MNCCRSGMTSPRGVSKAPAGQLLQRKCACGGTPGPTGECAECRKKRLGLQTRLAINTPGDRYEQEANRTAEAIMRLATPAGAPYPAIQRLSYSPDLEEEKKEEEEELVQAKEGAGRAVAPEAGVEGQIRQLQGGGAPLPATARDFFEPCFGHDFGRVRVHTGSQAAAAARNVNALAFTLGRDIVFGAGQYAPQTPAGQQLLAHELTHVVQQGQAGTPAAMLQRQDDVPVTSPAGEAVPAENAPAKKEATPICEPNRKLTWADFTGKVPKETGFGANTKPDFVQIPNTSPVQYQAKLVSDSSWAVERLKNPSNRTATGCQAIIDQCKKANKPFKVKTTTDPNCPAKPTLDTQATTDAECDSVVGKDCDAVMKTESDRVLAHEQLHFDIACVLTKKANAAIAAGGDAASIKSSLIRKYNDVSIKQYDGETKNGCIADKQASWAAEAAKGLPKVTVP